MTFAFTLWLIAITGGTLLTYLYEKDAPLVERLCAGTCTGFALLGMIGFVAASLLGLGGPALTLAAAALASPLLLLAKRDIRERLRADGAAAARAVRQVCLHPDSAAIFYIISYGIITLLMWVVFKRAMYVQAGGIYTGVDHNLGDLPLHLGIIASFVDGENFPPEHPEFAGARLVYPFIVDFVAAMFVRAGASLEGALFWENLALALALVGLLHRWARRLTGDPVAALISVALVLLSGGFGWSRLIQDAGASNLGIAELLARLPHNYTLTLDGAYRWGNALTVLLIPQRGLLLGLPLAILVLMQWWRVLYGEGAATEEAASRDPLRTANTNKRKGNQKDARPTAALGRAPAPPPSAAAIDQSIIRRMIAAGLITGLLPLVHAHSFGVLMTTAACLALLFRRWRAWVAFFVAALVVAAPQAWWAIQGSAVQTERFLGWHWGWDRGEHNAVWFWLKNTGLFLPLLIAAVVWRGRAAARGRHDSSIVPRALLLFYVPFTIWFVVPNLIKLAPWVWDNVKVLFYWYVASAPLVALLLARLWHAGGARRIVTITLLVLLTLAGSLDVWRVATGSVELEVYNREALQFAEVIKLTTSPRSLMLHAPTYNHPVFLTGRRSVMGYPGHLWSHGLDYKEREADVRSIYAGGPGAEALLQKYGIEYVTVGPLERSLLPVREEFFKRFAKVGEAGAHRLYKTTRR